MKNNKLRVAIRVDASHAIGTGHLMRCLTLANKLRQHGADIIFISRTHPGHLIHKLEEAAFTTYRLSAPVSDSINNSNSYAAWLGLPAEQDATETLAIIQNNAIDWLIVDHYSLDISWERLLRTAVQRIMVIDDLANREHDCDLLLDQNYFGEKGKYRYINRVPVPCRQLLGPRYALLQPEYAQLRSTFQQRHHQICKVLVFFGGSDLEEHTGKVLDALNSPDLLHLTVDVVIGPNYPNLVDIEAKVANRSKTTLHRNLPTLAHLMARVDFLIGAGGGTTWERMCLGLPSLIISIAKNQEIVAQTLALDGFQVLLPAGKRATSIEWFLAIKQLINNTSLIQKLIKNTTQLVDGLGSQRISSILMEGKNG